jgi:hypothetical protein
MKVMANSVERVSACVPAAGIHRRRALRGHASTSLAGIRAGKTDRSTFLQCLQWLLARPAVSSIRTALAYRCGGSTVRFPFNCTHEQGAGTKAPPLYAPWTCQESLAIGQQSGYIFALQII